MGSRSGRPNEDLRWWDFRGRLSICVGREGLTVRREYKLGIIARHIERLNANQYYPLDYVIAHLLKLLTVWRQLNEVWKIRSTPPGLGGLPERLEKYVERSGSAFGRNTRFGRVEGGYGDRGHRWLKDVKVEKLAGSGCKS